MKSLTQNVLLRSPEADPLSSSVEEKVLFPLIRPDTLMRFVIRSAEKKTNEKTANEQLIVKCATQKDSLSTDGETLHAGFTVQHRINIKVTENVTAKRIGDDIKVLCQACGIKGKTVREVIDGSEAILKDAIFDAKVGVKEDKSGQFEPQNTIRPIPLKAA